MTSPYPFSEGRPLEIPNNYSFARVDGEFVNSFLFSRSEMLSRALSDQTSSAEPEDIGVFDEIRSEIRYETRFESCENLKMLVKRFAVSKKVWSNYSPEWRPATEASSQNLLVYLEFADLLCHGYEKFRSPQLLNALLQCNDILCAYQSKFEAAENRALSKVLLREMNFLKNLAIELNVEL